MTVELRKCAHVHWENVFRQVLKLNKLIGFIILRTKISSTTSSFKPSHYKGDSVKEKQPVRLKEILLNLNTEKCVMFSLRWVHCENKNLCLHGFKWRVTRTMVFTIFKSRSSRLQLFVSFYDSRHYFRGLGVWDENCRQRFLCELSKDPEKFFPLSSTFLDETR